MLLSKWDNLSPCSTKSIHVCKKLPFAFLLQAEQIFSVNIWYIYFFNSVGGFCGFFLYYFQKLQLLVTKFFWNNYCCIAHLIVWFQKMCFRVLKSYFKLEILIFLSFVVSSLVHILNQNAPFLTKKLSAVKS